jgi:L-ascorbate metabolism protein UlaG (beta-lactamase superfamily)
VYFAGDTDLFEGMSQLAGAIDLALLPIWGWGPTLGPGHLDPERAVTAALRIAPRVVVPIHWGTLAPPRPARRPRDPARPGREFAELMALRAPQIEVRVLAPGERTEISPVAIDPRSRP